MDPVIHQPDLNRFIVELVNPKDSSKAMEPARLDYILLDNNTIDFTHTLVPFRARGQGHAEALVEAGLSWAKQQGYTIHASCWYVDKFLK